MADESTRQVREDAASEAGELGLWLASLRSLLSPKNQPGGAQPGATQRDYRCEAQALREILFRCLHLTSDLAGERGALNRQRPAEARAGQAAPGDAETQSPPELDADELDRLGEGLKGVCALCDAALSAGAVGFDAWVELGGSLQRTLADSEAARVLSSSARDWPWGQGSGRLTALAERASPEELAEDVQRVFDGFAHLLGLLTFAETSLASDAPLKPLLSVFALIHEQTRDLLDFIELVSRGEAGDEGVRDALDGTAYAVRMELRKTFEQELEGFCSATDPAHTYSRVESACGLLRNCFQQSVVAVAQGLDPAVQGRELFDSFITRLDESLLLREELWSLIHFVRDAESRPTQALVPVVAEGLYAFREGSLRYLMYKDREPFEKFLEEVETARGQAELSNALHRLGAFLETLFGQVNMRAALAHHPFDPNEVGLNFS